MSRRTVSAAVLGLALGGCSVVVDVGGFHAQDAHVGQPDGGPDAFVPMPDAFVPDAFVPPDAGPCEGGCGAGETCCDDTCVTLDSLDHCGACGNDCPVPTNAEATCDGVGCSFACDPGFSDCNADSADGCERAVNTATDCGACGDACAPTEVCDIGAGDTYVCVSTCTGGTVACGTSCVDTQTSMSHCGGCDVPCENAANATAVCDGGGCVQTCNVGFDDCNGDLTDPTGDGCEAELATDVDHCGGCGDRCFVDGATSECVDSMCRIASCTGPRGDCDRDFSTGCETATDTHTNCGGCGITCGLDQDCVGSACVPCTPIVVRVATGMAPAPPSGMRVSCHNGPGSGSSPDCPVAQCGLLSTWAFSYLDNRVSFGVVTYDPTNAIVREAERPGGRYLWNITLDAPGERATFHGQDTGTATVPWSDLRLPGP